MSFIKSFTLALFLFQSLCFWLPSSVEANPLDTITDLVTGGGDEGPDINALVDQQSALIKELNSALYHLNTSLERMLRALGLQEAADAANATAEAVKAGELTGRDEIKKVVAATKEATAAANEKMLEGVVLDAEGKVIFASSLPHYGFGSVKMVTTAQAASEAAQSLQNTTDLTILSKVGSLLEVGMQAPGLISTFGSATSNIMKFAQDNGIDTEKLENEAYDEDSLADD